MEVVLFNIVDNITNSTLVDFLGRLAGSQPALLVRPLQCLVRALEERALVTLVLSGKHRVAVGVIHELVEKLAAVASIFARGGQLVVPVGRDALGATH